MNHRRSRHRSQPPVTIQSLCVAVAQSVTLRIAQEKLLIADAVPHGPSNQPLR